MCLLNVGVYPKLVNEGSFFTQSGEYRVDEAATPAMKNSIMYKMSYYRFAELFGGAAPQDRVRGTKLPSEGPKLTHLEEAYTTENWIVRIFKVKDLDNLGRDLASATAFEEGKGKKRKSRSKKSRSRRRNASD
ncbi:hypothetical protein BC936DRAFT_136917 [Jimgerdemannia flammicorona]|uniref:Uncharacterized protein n=1 Tax=Jimgerdemannia flammicorona TaxID=994334 RepID=A0A433CYH1_9FUNG|nr:hypothetical protein BC936DRAFT_136917 [Jimgerdemannia flammicorona]